MNKLTDIIAEDKRRTKVINDAAIDWRNFERIAPQLLHPDSKNSPEFEDVCAAFEEVCLNLISGIGEIKNIILEPKKEE